MVEKLKKKGMTIKDEPGVSLVKIFGSGVGIEKVRDTTPSFLLGRPPVASTWTIVFQ